MQGKEGGANQAGWGKIAIPKNCYLKDNISPRKSLLRDL